MDKEKPGSGGGEAGNDRDVYKTRRAQPADRPDPMTGRPDPMIGRPDPMADRAQRNVTDLMTGVSRAVAEAARTFGDTLRERAEGDRSRPTHVVEAGALSASRMFAVLAESWQGFYDNLVRDHRAAPAEPIDYERLAELVAQKLKAADKPTKV